MMSLSDRLNCMLKPLPRWILAALLLAPGGAAAAPPVDQADLIRRLRAKGFPLYDKYKGVSSRRQVTTEERDPETNALEKTKTMRVAVTEYFYEPLKRTVLQCKVDGKPAKNKECEGRKGRKPTWPIFDRQGQKNYNFRWVGQKTVHGVPCHKLRVIPRKRTDRHMSGHLYVALDSLEPKLLEATVADLPFPLRKFYLKLRFTQLDGHPVVSRGYVDLVIKVPLFVHRRIISRFRASGSKLVPR
jgi:hypothetical protein